ncbi:MAG: amino acid adenylation domain-containing protein, partial [Chloroflexi bacterium]|nr:amino acid adenylation domain-containing protein [Chloroflexota bacterium]
MLKSTEPAESSVALEKDVQDSLLQETMAETSSTRNTERVVPLSFAQQQMWIQAQLIPDAPVYNESLTIHLPGRLNIPALGQSLNEIIERHEAWRTSFPLVNGQPVQMIHPAFTFPLSIVDLQHLPKAKRESEALRLATEQATSLFDLTKVPLLRATLVSLDEEDHRLLLTLHHIIFDRWSIYRVFLPELHTLYEAFSNGNPSPLPPPAIQYADFAIQQRESWQENIHAEQLAYWKQQLAHAPAAMNLPTDRPTPLMQSYRGSKFPFTLSKDVTDRLKALSDREGVTLYMTLVAAFQILLYRYTAQQDIMIGTSTETREAPEEQTLMGLCINTLVLRTDLSGNPTFSDFLKRVREVVSEAEAHRAVPFEYLLKELQPTRGVGANTLLRVMLSLEAAPPILLSGWTVSQSEVELHTTRSDLSLALEDRAEGLAGWFEYSTDVFDEATIARLMQHWQTLLASVVADPTCQIAKLPLLTEAERHQLLVEWNANQVESSENGCIHQFFEAQVERTPEAVAVVFENTQLTYHELNVKANQLAHYLQQRGVGPEVLVCICVERSPELIVGLLAILKAGGAFVPLDPSHPQDRLDFILQDSQAAVLLTQQHIAEKLPEHRTQIICVDSSAEAIAQEPTTNPVSTVNHENLCYAIYTSGSTGNPKGVLITHGSMVRHCFAMSRHYQLDSSDRVLQFTTLTFDISLEQIFPTLISGAQLVLRDEEVWSTLEFHEKVLKFGLTVMNLGTPYWHQLAQEWADDPKLIQGNQLRLVVVGGDRMIPYYLNLWQQTPLASVRLLNAYGPAETTITSTTFEVPPQFGKDTPREQVPIGRPLPHRKCYVLDTYKEPVPIGVPGELYIGGDILARSYLNRPELSVERFIPDPFSDEPDARMYKTGDLVRYLPDGNIEFLGRVDFQVKIRGFRIELGEIEGALRLHSAVQETVVIAHEDSPGNKSLVAYIVPASGLKPTVSSLQQYLKEKLPEYMVPAAFVFLDTLPLTPNGKIDRRALPEPSSAVRPTEEAFVAPTSMAHYQLLQ